MIITLLHDQVYYFFCGENKYFPNVVIVLDDWNILDEGDDLMAAITTQVRIDSDIIEQANALFSSLGLNMSTAVNLFLHQCVLCGGLPFAVEMPRYNEITLDAMAEAKRISRNPDVKGYRSMEELKAVLND